ncbi:anti-CBASS protein Acb1 family protein [Candidatus Clostridium helianthi]|uniref:Anti-CBASS protein Acb1 family protein n=1 Tax=Candidatus Clostridium helianthi TaxID=3381660 RepID=A0ABW8S9Y7_9CLOT
MKKTKRNRNYNKQYTKDGKIIQNSNKAKKTAIMDAFQNVLARLGAGTPNLIESTDYPMTRLTQNFQLLNSLYRSHWIIRKIIDCPAEDMVKNWIDINTQMDPDDIERFERLQRRTRVKRDILQCLKWSRLYGGAAAVIIIEGHENMLDQPLDYDSIMPNSFKGLIPSDRWTGITPGADMITDVTNPDFGLPEYYEWATDEFSVKVHHSRILRFTGRDLTTIERYTEQHWGISEVELLFDELKKRDNTSFNIAQLVFLANLRVLKMGDLGELLAIGNEDGQKDLYNTIQAQNWLMNNMGMYLLNKEDDFQTHQYSFSGLNDIYESFMLDIAGAAEMPVTKIFGRSPQGMNATGDGDKDNYYNTIEQKQTAQLEPALDKLLPIMYVSEFGAVPEDLDYSFNPIETPSEDKLAEIVDKKSSSIINVYNAGLISRKVGLKELRQLGNTTGMFTNITDEDIDNATDDINIGDLPPSNNGFIPYNNDKSIYSMDADPDNLEIEIESEQMAINTYELEIERSIKQGDWEAVAKFKEILEDEKDHLRILNNLKKNRGW